MILHHIPHDTYTIVIAGSMLNIDAATAEAFAAEIGATAAPTPKDVAEAAGVVVTMLPSGADVTVCLTLLLRKS